MLKSPYLNIILFLVTIITTTLAGAEWIYGKSFFFQSDMMGLAEFKEGLWFSLPFLGFLTTHEFGHYFMAKIRKIGVTLPYYIPGWFVVLTSIGTFGAFIKIKDKINSKNDYFDIGIAGPLAGFVVAVVVLACGFYYLPPDEYIYTIHPEYKNFQGNYRPFLDTYQTNGEIITLGKSLIYNFLESNLANPSLIPHKFELTHYPLILAGFLGLLFTALNLLPIGQLDGGHILFALIGKKAFDVVSPVFLVLLVSYSGLGMFKLTDFTMAYSEEQGMLLLQFLFFVYFNYLCFSKIFYKKLNSLILALVVILFQLTFSKYVPQISGYSGFLAFGFLIGRVLGVYHPETIDTKPLGITRKILGWLAIFIFFICFSPNPIN
ncbi:MAG: site-2 protease family protein [Leadbetterella sp.]|nr:site-2 protease family protein [Leadbetterella sp.]